MYRLCILLVSALSAGCSTSEVLLAHRVDLVEAGETVAEAELLDVGIVVFDPDVPEGEIDHDTREKLLQDGIFVHIRRAESVQMAMQLRRTMQRSGHWGSVWVTPDESTAADLTVTAKILESDGYAVRLDVDVVDATGRKWIDEDYELETAAWAYNGTRYADVDPYQDIFNAIANDLAAARKKLSPEDVQQIKTVGALRYAVELSPEAFAGYVVERRGIHTPVRLPAADDPMLDRTKHVRQRERLFFDTLDQHYQALVTGAEDSYAAWRMHAREESLAIREATRSARWRAGLGAAAMLVSILYGGGSGAEAASFSETLLRDSTFLIGTELLSMRADALRGREMSSKVLEELSQSFDDEIKPMVVELDGVQHRLTGTAEAQFEELRHLLRRDFLRERGFPRDGPKSVAAPDSDVPQ